MQTFPTEVLYYFSDIDECKESPVPVCSQICTDTKGHYKCSCVPGYRLEHILGQPGKTTCKIEGMINALLITHNSTPV